MSRYRISDLAQAELEQVREAYTTYFIRLSDPAKGRAWAQRFYRAYRQRIEELKSNPYRYAACSVFPFDSVETEYRSFVVDWFTVFYTVEEDEDAFTVWHIRSSHSDSSRMIRP